MTDKLKEGATAKDEFAYITGNIFTPLFKQKASLASLLNMGRFAAIGGGITMVLGSFIASMFLPLMDVMIIFSLGLGLMNFGLLIMLSVYLTQNYIADAQRQVEINNLMKSHAGITESLKEKAIEDSKTIKIGAGN